MKTDLNAALPLFQNEGCMVVFAVLYTDGSTRQDLLGVRRIHYVRRTAADEWLAGIEEKIRSAAPWVTDVVIAEALDEIWIVHSRMTYK